MNEFWITTSIVAVTGFTNLFEQEDGSTEESVCPALLLQRLDGDPDSTRVVFGDMCGNEATIEPANAVSNYIGTRSSADRPGAARVGTGVV